MSATDKSPMKSFGFTYEHEGASFMFHIVASSAEEAISRAQKLGSSQLIGELGEANTHEHGKAGAAPVASAEHYRVAEIAARAAAAQLAQRACRGKWKDPTEAAIAVVASWSAALEKAKALDYSLLGAAQRRPNAAELQPHPLMPFPLVLRSFKLPETGEQVHVSIGTADDTWSVGMPGKTLFEAAGSLMRWADMAGGFAKLRELGEDKVRASGLRPVGNPNDAEISRMRWTQSAVSTRGKSEASDA